MVKIFDCTIRDGGHINNWKFTDDCFLASLLAAQESGAEYFETGYRSTNAGGKFARSSDDDLKNILPENLTIKLAVMLNVRDFDESLFAPKIDSSITSVRIACHKNEIQKGITISEKLAGLGYEVFLHIMAIAELDETDFNLIKNWDKKNILKSLYFADSYGGFFNKDIEFFYKKLQSLGFEKISFHAHNNLQMAFSNTIKAIELGAYSVDGSIYGMGRGAGNLPVEMLVGHLAKENYNFKPESYFEVIQKYYLPLSQEYNWGYDLKNLICGLKNIHP